MLYYQLIFVIIIRFYMYLTLYCSRDSKFVQFTFQSYCPKIHFSSASAKGLHWIVVRNSNFLT